MALLDQVPLTIKNDDDIKVFIRIFKKWDADPKKAVSPVFPSDLLDFTRRLVENLDIHINNPPSPTIADYGREEYSRKLCQGYTYENSYNPERVTEPIRNTSDRSYDGAVRLTRTYGYTYILPRVTRLERSVSSVNGRVGRLEEDFYVFQRLLRRINRQLGIRKVRRMQKNISGKSRRRKL